MFILKIIASAEIIQAWLVLGNARLSALCQPHLLQELPEQRDGVLGILLLHNVAQVLHRNPPAAAPHLGVVHVAVPWQLGQECSWVPIHELHYGVGGDSLILLDLPVQLEKLLIQILH